MNTQGAKHRQASGRGLRGIVEIGLNPVGVFLLGQRQRTHTACARWSQAQLLQAAHQTFHGLARQLGFRFLSPANLAFAALHFIDIGLLVTDEIRWARSQ